MRFTRQILAIAILALYVAQGVGGRIVHLWQHSAGNGSCCGEAPCGISTNGISTNGISTNGISTNLSYHHKHSRDHCHHHGEDGNHDHQRDGHSPGENQKHDSSTCWVCQVLGQAQDKPIELGAAVVLTAAPATVVALPDFCPSPSRSGFRTRAPPVIWT